MIKTGRIPLSAAASPNVQGAFNYSQTTKEASSSSQSIQKATQSVSGASVGASPKSGETSAASSAVSGPIQNTEVGAVRNLRILNNKQSFFKGYMKPTGGSLSSLLGKNIKL